MIDGGMDRIKDRKTLLLVKKNSRKKKKKTQIVMTLYVYKL